MNKNMNSYGIFTLQPPINLDNVNVNVCKLKSRASGTDTEGSKY